VTTSLRDLLDAVDDQTMPGAYISPGDATQALSILGRLLHRVAELDVDGWLDAAQHERTRVLADACVATEGILPGEPGRVADLLGAASDVVGVLRDDLTGLDGWEVAVGVASVAMRCVDTARVSGPYRSVYPLATVRERARQLIRLGAATPPDPARGSGLDIALPSTVVGRSPAARTAYEPMAAMLGHLRNRSRDPLTVVEVHGVIGAARAIAEESAWSQVSVARGDLACCPDAAAWRGAEDRICSMAVDGVAGGADDRLLVQVTQIHEAVARMSASATAAAPVRDLARAAKLLPSVAALLQHDVGHLSGRLLVRRGARPISEGRVGEWLRKVAFIADDVDVAPVIAALRVAATTAASLAARVAVPTPDLHLGARSVRR
jgi:hypothetical protein